MDQEKLAELILNRRTRKPASFHAGVPSDTITQIINTARHAPNHHRTEPARFYLLNRDKIILVAQLMAETIKGDGQDPILVERALRKENEWSNAPGLLLVTSFSDSNSVLFSKNQNLIEKIMQPPAALSKIFSCFSKRVKYLQNGVPLRFGNILNLKKLLV